MTDSTGLIILHTTKFGENSIVIHTLSQKYGRRGFLVRGLGKKSLMALFQPLSVLEADIRESSKSTLYTATSLTSIYPLSGIRGNLYKNAMTMFIAEVLFRTIKEGSDEHGVYQWCERNILLLDAIQSNFSNFHIRFLLEFAVVLGFSPEAQDIMPFAGEHYPVIERFMTESFAESMMIPLSGSVRNDIAERLLRYIEHHTESALNVNSLKVLHELFI